MTQWDDLDYLIIDLPPGTGDIQLSLVQKIPISGVIIVTTPQAVATLDAEKALKMFTKTKIDVLGIIENMSTLTCEHCGHHNTIFSGHGVQKLCDTYQCNLLGQLPLDSRIATDCDQGLPTALGNQDTLAGAFNHIALQTSIALAKKPLNWVNPFPPIVVE